MVDRWLPLLLQQAALISAGITVLALLRPLLQRLGAGALYASWLLLPLLLLTPALPRPETEPLHLALQATGALALPTVAIAHGDGQAGLAAWGMCLWLAGAALVVLHQAWRQWLLGRHGATLPAGSSPALVGLLRPRVALPADFEQRFPARQRELILAHEAVHRARHDNLWNLIACGLAALHWWNPLVWWAARRLRADQELACDAAVLAAHPNSRQDYTHALLAAHDLRHLGAPLASRWGTHHPLVERISMLNRSRTVSRRAALTLALACLGITGLAYAAQALPNEPAASAAADKVDIRLTINAEGGTTTPRLITALGQRARIEWGDSPEQSWRLDLTVTRAEDGQLQVVTLPQYGGRPLGQHTGTLPSGTPFGMRLGGHDGVPPLTMTRVVSLMPADAPMPAPQAGTTPSTL